MLGQPDDELLSALPVSLYRRDCVSLRRGGRGFCLINEPAAIRQVLVTEEQNFPKSDLMIAALKPLLGDGILISNGPTWQRQRVMLEPTLLQMRVRRQFPVMAETVAAFARRLDAMGTGSEIVLDPEISFFSLDAIFRTIFSRPIDVAEAREVFEAYSVYQALAARHEAVSLFATGLPAAAAGSDASLGAAGEQIRRLIDGLIEQRLASPALGPDDVLDALMASRDPLTGQQFDRAELVDQIAVLFLAGHDTSASALTWCMFLVSQSPELAEQIRSEADTLAPGRPLTQEELNKIVSLRNAFRESLRLYPPSAFMTRVARHDTTVGGLDIEAGNLVVVSPWLIHRHEKYWQDPKCFDPGRFSEERERGITAGAYLPFGLGPRVCPGRALAMIEGPLMVAELVRRFTFVTVEPEQVMPSYRLTVQPRRPIRCRIDRLPTQNGPRERPS